MHRPAHHLLLLLLLRVAVVLVLSLGVPGALCDSSEFIVGVQGTAEGQSTVRSTMASAATDAGGAAGSDTSMQSVIAEGGKCSVVQRDIPVPTGREVLRDMHRSSVCVCVCGITSNVSRMHITHIIGAHQDLLHWHQSA